MLKLIKCINARICSITRDDNYTQALEQAFLQKPKIAKPIIKRMCDATKTIYLDKEQDIDFPRVIDGLIELGLAGLIFLCTKVKQSKAMINNELMDSIGGLKYVLWQVNMIIKTKGKPYC